MLKFNGKKWSLLERLYFSGLILDDFLFPLVFDPSLGIYYYEHYIEETLKSF